MPTELPIWGSVTQSNLLFVVLVYVAISQTVADFIHCKSKLYVWCTLQQFILNYGWVESSCSSIKYNVLVWVLKAKYDFLIDWKWIFADMSRGNSNLPLFFFIFIFFIGSHITEQVHCTSESVLKCFYSLWASLRDPVVFISLGYTTMMEKSFTVKWL